MPPAKAKEYLWAELGALVGAVLAVPLAVGVLRIEFWVFRSESLEDLSRFIEIGLSTGVGVLVLGSTFGCWFALRRAGYPAALKIAGMLFLLLLVTYLAAVASTGPGFDFELVDAPAKFVPPATLVPLATPLVATWIISSVPKSVTIQTFFLLLLGLGAYGLFSRSSVAFLPVPVATPAVEEEVLANGELPLGSENPCWAGTYPDDLAFLESEEIPVRDFLVDREAGDIYYLDCVGVQLSNGANWPPGLAERLVRSSDL